MASGNTKKVQQEEFQKDFDTLEKAVLKRIKPSPEEDKALMAFYEELRGQLKDLGAVELMGSAAKGTRLASKKEIDLFVLIPPSAEAKGTLKAVVDKIAKRMKEAGYKTLISYAEHPYVRIEKAGMEADIVPSFKMEGFRISQLISAVDRTQFHVRYVNKHMKDEQRDEVRLLKQFLRNFSLYGAEVRVGGFSGYLCELLVLKLGSFRETLRFFANASPPIRLAMTTKELKYAQNFEPRKGQKEQQAVEGRGTKTTPNLSPPFIFVDPVDHNRNVASPVRAETLSKLILAARSYIKRPSMEHFFFEEEESLESSSISISFKAASLHDDVKFGMLRRIGKKLSTFLEALEFDVLEQAVFNEEEKDIIWLALDSDVVKPAGAQRGPPISAKAAMQAFLKKHTSFYIDKEGRIWTRKAKPCSDALSCTQLFFKRESGSIKPPYKKPVAIELDREWHAVKREKALKSFIRNILAETDK